MPTLDEKAVIARLNQKVLVESGFGRNHPEMIALGGLEAENNLRRSSEYCRYPRMYALRDERMPAYNANQVYPGIWTGEGPAKIVSDGVRYDNVLRFFQGILFNEHIAFTHIVALGPEFDPIGEGPSFYPYFRNCIEEKDRHEISLDEAYSLKSSKTELQCLDFTTYHLKARNDQGEKKQIGLTHFQNMLDMGRLHASPFIVARLLWLAECIKQETVFIHCSAGLGRSGTITYALMLFHDYMHLNRCNEDDLVLELFARFNTLNKARPGSIQNSYQLKNALDIAEAMHRLQEKLLEQNQTLEAFTAELLEKEKAKNPIARWAETGYESDDESASDKRTVAATVSIKDEARRKVSIRMFSQKPPCDEGGDPLNPESMCSH